MTASLHRRALASAAGIAIDRAIGEPPASVHPVAVFGSVMQRLERVYYRDTRSAGAGYAALGTGIGLIVGAMVPTALVVAASAAGRELRCVAAAVRNALATSDLDHARALLPNLVGRDPSALDAAGVSAAVIESLAENTVDAVVGPAFWGAVAGGPGAGAYRAVNTMDAMVGHRSSRYEQFGWASARLDDAANLIPARLTALLVAAVRPVAVGHIARAVRHHAPAHPSPNAGVAEAAFAAALGVELGGPLRYGDRDEDRPRLGWGPRPGPNDIERAIALAAQVEAALVALLLAVAVSGRWRRSRRAP